jgi:6-phosphogluconate dehydrogenase (decarboxylating)
MLWRLPRAGHRCVVCDLHSEAVQALVKQGALEANSLEVAVMTSQELHRFSVRGANLILQKPLQSNTIMPV